MLGNSIQSPASVTESLDFDVFCVINEHDTNILDRQL